MPYAILAAIPSGEKGDFMWEAYVRHINNAPCYFDRYRLESRIQGKLPDPYWQLVCEHQGDTLNASMEIHGQGEVNFGVLLLAISLENEKENYSYCIEFCLSNMLGYYPDGILPFADDTGGNYWAFDFRNEQNLPAITFIDHEVPGEEGVIYASENFDSFMDRLIVR